ncbi:MAG TPA: alkaline phosphatase family protein [Dongiaceae bacterium]|nr:Type I phosphodiesterase/nucleotide pyrophosphatase [Verrucomicrobiota bacterium]HXP59267.1 alkaline phosphatase family protein [Dongiaceae bacterium]
MLLVGWDAADWKVIEPLLEAGQMPNLARLMAGGVHGNLATIYPVLSPMLWTSIATGKRADKHGIHGFSEPLPDGSGVRPITVLSRKTKALWNILNQTGRRSLVVGWWPSHPAEPIDGVMVSDQFQNTMASEQKPFLPPGTVHPAALAASLAELQVNPMELRGEFIRPFVPAYEKVDQKQDKRLHSLGKIIADTMSVHAVATELLATQPWDFAAVYYSGIDHFSHAFMRYHPPHLPWVTEEDFALYRHVVANAYCYHDSMLGALLALADENTTVVLMSDHGFHPDHLRSGYIPAEPAGPAVEHRHFGILCLKGPAVRANERLLGASVLDVCPTILTLFGLPPGQDMDGKVLVTAFKEPPLVQPIESWDCVVGHDGTHAPETRLDAVASAQAFQQLVELGYVAPPAANVQETVAECLRELKYNLARACRDGNHCGQAAELAEGLWTRWPKEHRFGILLVDCLGVLRRVAQRRAAIEELGRRIERYQAQAQAQLAQRPMKQDGQPSGPTPRDEDLRAQFEQRQLRELALGRPLLLEWFLATQALLEHRPAEARQHLDKLTQAENLGGGLGLGVASALAELGDLAPARALLEAALQSDPQDPLVLGQLAGLHFKAGRLDQAIAAATESLSLLYFQPALHALLGHALMEAERLAEAEQELLVAVAQSPRHLAGHELLARLYRELLNCPEAAFAHEGRARSLRHELVARIRARGDDTSLTGTEPVQPTDGQHAAAPTKKEDTTSLLGSALAPPFGPEVERRQVITVVSGLPRSGTSMMMQVLLAAGRAVLTDCQRAPDEDNPLGYLEFEPARHLGRDASWLPQARGKVVKIVAQLLPFLPVGEHYQVILMERDLTEVVASQRGMLARQSRRGAELDERELLETYAKQLQVVRRALDRRPDLRLLPVSYAELLAKPEPGVDRLAQFLGDPFDRQAAARAIRPDLRRQMR